MKVSKALLGYENLLEFRDFQDGNGKTHKLVSHDNFWIARFCVDRNMSETNVNAMIKNGAGNSPDSDVFAEAGCILVKWNSEISNLSKMFGYAMKEGQPVDNETYYEAQAKEINNNFIRAPVSEAMSIEDDFGIAVNEVYDTADDYVEKINQLGLLELSDFEAVLRRLRAILPMRHHATESNLWTNC